jgi:hypothetical protein
MKTVIPFFLVRIVATTIPDVLSAKTYRRSP